MSFVTPQLAIVKSRLEEAWPSLKYGIYNRRKIAGTTTWSQHSWPNAVDLFFTRYGDTSPVHQSMLEDLSEWLYFNTSLDEVRNTLWNIPAHYDHIHIDFWPRGYGVPSIVRGGVDNLYKTIDGRVISQAQLKQEGDEMPQFTEEEAKSLRAFLAELKNVGSSVYFAGPAVELIRESRKYPLHRPTDNELLDHTHESGAVKR
jgi:hypothetical protein